MNSLRLFSIIRFMTRVFWFFSLLSSWIGNLNLRIYKICCVGNFLATFLATFLSYPKYGCFIRYDWKYLKNICVFLPKSFLPKNVLLFSVFTCTCTCKSLFTFKGHTLVSGSTGFSLVQLRNVRVTFIVHELFHLK